MRVETVIGQYAGTHNDFWETPPRIINPLAAWGCDFDLACTASNTKFKHYFDANFFDAMIEEWPKNHICFLNPPFSRAREFVEKTVCEAKLGKKIVLLYKASNLETDIWQDWIFPNASAILFLKRRVIFLAPPTLPPAKAPPFGCALVFFNIPLEQTGGIKIPGFWFGRKK